jgi:hypothetical protein
MDTFFRRSVCALLILSLAWPSGITPNQALHQKSIRLSSFENQALATCAFWVAPQMLGATRHLFGHEVKIALPAIVQWAPHFNAATLALGSVIAFFTTAALSPRFRSWIQWDLTPAFLRRIFIAYWLRYHAARANNSRNFSRFTNLLMETETKEETLAKNLRESGTLELPEGAVEAWRTTKLAHDFFVPLDGERLSDPQGQGYFTVNIRTESAGRNVRIEIRYHRLSRSWPRSLGWVAASASKFLGRSGRPVGWIQASFLQEPGGPIISITQMHSDPGQEALMDSLISLWRAHIPPLTRIRYLIDRDESLVGTLYDSQRAFRVKGNESTPASQLFVSRNQYGIPVYLDNVRVCVLNAANPGRDPDAISSDWRSRIEKMDSELAASIENHPFARLEISPQDVHLTVLGGHLWIESVAGLESFWRHEPNTTPFVRNTTQAFIHDFYRRLRMLPAPGLIRDMTHLLEYGAIDPEEITTWLEAWQNLDELQLRAIPSSDELANFESSRRMPINQQVRLQEFLWGLNGNTPHNRLAMIPARGTGAGLFDLSATPVLGYVFGNRILHRDYINFAEKLPPTEKQAFWTALINHRTPDFGGQNDLAQEYKTLTRGGTAPDEQLESIVQMLDPPQRAAFRKAVRNHQKPDFGSLTALAGKYDVWMARMRQKATDAASQSAETEFKKTQVEDFPTRPRQQYWFLSLARTNGFAERDILEGVSRWRTENRRSLRIWKSDNLRHLEGNPAYPAFRDLDTNDPDWTFHARTILKTVLGEDSDPLVESEVRFIRDMIAAHPQEFERDWRAAFRWIGAITEPGNDFRNQALYALCVREGVFQPGQPKLMTADKNVFRQKLLEWEPWLPEADQELLIKVFFDIVIPAQAQQSLNPVPLAPHQPSDRKLGQAG